ncbi:hypothetical protein Peur_062762 [Populus x canadensis]
MMAIGCPQHYNWSYAPHQTTHHVGIMYSSSPGQGKSVVFMGQISLVRLHIFTSILRRLLMSRRCSHGNRKSMGFGRKWRRESPTIKCIIVFSFIIVCPFHHVPNGSPSDSG